MKNKGSILDFVAFDLETTGLTDKDKIIEFGAARFENGKIKEEFDTLINPEMIVSNEVLLLTGIEKDKIKKAPLFKDVMDDITDFIGAFPLVAHNAPFDISFIKREIPEILNPVFDTLELSRILLPFTSNHRLKTIYELFGNEKVNFHRALTDAIACGRIFLNLIEILEFLPTPQLEKILTIFEKVKDDMDVVFKGVFQNRLSGNNKENIDMIGNLFKISSNICEFKPIKETTKLTPTEKTVEKILTHKEIFNKAQLKYEKRAEQIALAKMVMKAFLSEEILVSEAGTGTGKTFAYLIPSILWSNFSDERVLVSTYTKNLEEQLFQKDIISLAQGLNLRFKTALLKGRNNYLCLKRWNNIFNENLISLDRDEKKGLLKLIIWKILTKTGDISENSSFWLNDNLSLWSKLSCDALDCEMSKCPYFQECYLARIRKTAQKANIVVINHSLLLSDLTMEQKLLGEYDRLIIDEAHNLEKAATDFLGITVSVWQMRNLLGRLYKNEQGVLLKVRNFLLLTRKGKSDIKIDDVDKCIDFVTESNHLLSEISGTIKVEVKESEYRGKLRLKKDEGLVEEIRPSNEKLYSNLKYINDLIKKFLDIFGDKEKPQREKEFINEITQFYKESVEIMENFFYILSCNDGNNCFWVEFYEGNKNIKLVSAPIVVANRLKKELFEKLNTAILVSATILVENSFRYFEEKIGLLNGERVKEFAAGSSFDFGKQVQAFLPPFISSPQKNEFLMDVVDILRKLALSIRRGTLVLFTSYKLLNGVYEQLLDIFNRDNILLLAQGKSGSKDVITKEFKEIEDSVLLGTYSFWEGFDAPGKALELLVITKLPFASPKEPIVEARMEYIESRGMNSFNNLIIPEAIIKLRQGFGRLIRSKDDRGIVIILDNRLVKKNYGRRFINSLPTTIKISPCEEHLFAAIKRFWQI